MTAPRLSQATLRSVRADVAGPAYDREATTIGIAHIGPGAFHRAHQAAYVDDLLHTDPRWSISAISLKSSAVRDALAAQDGLYTLTTLGRERQTRVIGSIREILLMPIDAAAVLQRLSAPQTSIVTLTVTEKGYCLDARGELDTTHADIVHDWTAPHAPRSAIGLLTAGLRLRRSQRVEPYAVISCDNLADNGPSLRNAVVAFAERIGRELARWIASQVSFPRTMVDSITPATDDDLRQRIPTDTGIVDAWPVQREAFTQWVIEDCAAVRAADWPSVGVTIATDVEIFERAKLRLLNGAHSTLAYIGALCGRETVLDAMNDPLLAAFVEKLMLHDIAPTLAASSQLDLGHYITSILERFRNPGVRHLLAQIAWDGSKKLPVRLMGTITEVVRAGRPTRRLALPIAAWMRFVARQAKAGIPIVDPDAERLASIGKACSGKSKEDVGVFVSASAVVSPELAANPQFMRDLQDAYDAMEVPAAALRSYS